MPRTCTICAHPRRKAVDSAIASGEALRRIAADFETTESSLRRHRAHLGGALAKAAERRGESIADGTLARLEAIQQRLWSLLDRLEADGDLRGAVGALREARELVQAVDDVVARARPVGGGATYEAQQEALQAKLRRLLGLSPE